MGEFYAFFDLTFNIKNIFVTDTIASKKPAGQSSPGMPCTISVPGMPGGIYLKTIKTKFLNFRFSGIRECVNIIR